MSDTRIVTLRLDAELVAEFDELTDNRTARIREFIKRDIEVEKQHTVEPVVRARIGTLERRIDRKRGEIDELEDEIDEREAEIGELRAEIDALEQYLDESRADRDEAFREAVETIDGPVEPDNLAVRTKADKLGVSPTELAEAVNERYDGDELTWKDELER